MARTIRTCSLAALLLAVASGPALAGPGVLSDYVRGRAQAARGDAAAAARGYGAMLAETASPAVALRAYREGLQAGDMALVRRAVVVLDTAGAAPPDAAILVLADAVARHDDRAVAAALDRLGAGPLDFLVPIVRGWVAFDAGADPFPLLDQAAANVLARRYAAENRALLLIATGRFADGVLAVQAAAAMQDELDPRVNAADLLLRLGERDRAVTLLAGDEPVLGALRASPGTGVKPSLAFGTARLLIRLADDVRSDRPSPLVVALLRAALLIEPGNPRAALMLGTALASDRNAAPALSVLDAIGRDGPYGPAAESARVGVLAKAGDDAAALSAADALAARADATAATLRSHGDLLSDRGRHADAAASYARAAALAGAAPDWRLDLQLGGALDRSGRWAEARSYLERAVAGSDGAPVALNFLGYALLDHREDNARARALLERAAKQRPADPAIIDSLAWAYFLGGDARRAVPLLERAAAAEPDDATIAEHLGDAYWSLGRRYEARYAWQAALLETDARDRARLTAKLADGPK